MAIYSYRLALPTLIALLTLALVITASCSAEQSPDYVEVLPRTTHAGDPMPAPNGNTIVEITGMGTGSSPIDIGVSQLESLGTVKFSVDDPYELTDVEYEGVLLSTMFEQFGGSESDSVTISAIDDYSQVIPREHTEKWPVLVALKSGGAYVKRDHRGPAMIIYPYDQYPELDSTTYDPFWVWQISHIVFN